MVGVLINPRVSKELLVALIEKSVVRSVNHDPEVGHSGTELTVMRLGKRLDGQQKYFKHTVEVRETSIIDGEGVLNVHSVEDGSTTEIRHNNIIEIDGMDPERVAKSFDLKANGTKAYTGKKRGRKPKNQKD